MADIETVTQKGLVPTELINDLRQIIDSARSHVAAIAFQIVAPLARKLSWSHFLIVMPLKDELQREFYLTMAASERWSKRTLQAKIDGMLFERTAIATKPDQLIKKELSTLRNFAIHSFPN